MQVVSVKALEHLRLEVLFADGLEGEVRLQPTHLYGIFAALKSPELFAKVNCKDGFVAWPGDIDLAPDAMYREIKERGQWVLS